jgi:hypothetical protein
MALSWSEVSWFRASNRYGSRRGISRILVDFLALALPHMIRYSDQAEICKYAGYMRELKKRK